MRKLHKETHYISRLGWLRAAVLGANDGLISTSSLIMSVASAHTSQSSILIAGAAGLVGGAMSMAAGEYISVSSQSDSEKAALAVEKTELKENPSNEIRELANIYVKRGLQNPLAMDVAKQLMAHDALGAHARDELGITEEFIARPLQAAFSSACSFTMGALLPLLLAIFIPLSAIPLMIFISTILFLGLLGGVAAKIGGAKIGRGISRVMVWGSLAMIVGATIGHFLGIAV